MWCIGETFFLFRLLLLKGLSLVQSIEAVFSIEFSIHLAWPFSYRLMEQRFVHSKFNFLGDYFDVSHCSRVSETTRSHHRLSLVRRRSDARGSESRKKRNIPIRTFVLTQKWEKITEENAKRTTVCGRRVQSLLFSLSIFYPEPPLSRSHSLRIPLRLCGREFN